jgi:hypothetical protein
VPQFQKRHERLANKGRISAFPVSKLAKKQCQKRHYGTVGVPFGTVQRSAGLRHGKELENIEHSTPNVQVFNSMFDVGR